MWKIVCWKRDTFASEIYDKLINGYAYRLGKVFRLNRFFGIFFKRMSYYSKQLQLFEKKKLKTDKKEELFCVKKEVKNKFLRMLSESGWSI